MTAFAFDILAALTGPGSKPGVGASVAQADGALGGAFEALLAGLVAQQDATPAATAAPGAMTDVAPAALAPLMASPPAMPALAASGDAEAPEATGLDKPSDQDLALAGAEALVLPAAASPDLTRPAADQGVGAVTVAAVDTAACAAVADPAPADRPEPAAALAAMLTASQGADAPAARPDLDKPVREAAPIAAEAFAPPAADAAADAAQPPVRPQAAAPTAAPVAALAAATPELLSLTARVLAPRAADSAADARAAREPEPAPSVEAPAADLAGVDFETVLSEPVEVALEAPVVAETPLPAPASSAGRRSARIDAARADTASVADRSAAPAPELKPVAAADDVAADAVPVVEAEPVVPAQVAVVAEDAGDAPASQAPVAQPAMHAASAAVAADPAAVVRGSPETVARLASDIVRKLEGQNTKFDVQLDPLGLGKVDVSIEINADGRLTAALSFETAQAADTLRGRAVELRQALEKAGFELTDASLSFDMNNQGGGAERQQAGERFAAWSSRAFQSVQSGLDQAEALLAAATYARSPIGGVDIRI